MDLILDSVDLKQAYFPVFTDELDYNDRVFAHTLQHMSFSSFADWRTSGWYLFELVTILLDSEGQLGKNTTTLLYKAIFL